MARPAPNPLHLIVFDWDGTLMDSLASMVACAQHALRAIGSGPADDEAIRRAIGLSLEEIISRLFPVDTPARAERFVTQYRHQWQGTFRHQSALFAGVEAMLEALTRQGYLLAVATSKSRGGLESDLQKTGLHRFFHATRTIDDAPSKPSPIMLLELCDELGARPAETLMVGDTPFDLQMADNADIAALGVLTGCHDRAALLACNPLGCLDSAADLATWTTSHAKLLMAATTTP